MMSSVRLASYADSVENAPLVVVSDDDYAYRDRWQEYVRGAPLAEAYHDYRWRQVIESVFGHRAHYLLAAEQEGRVRGVLPLVRMKSRLFGDFMISLPYLNYAGVLADTPQAGQALLAAAGDLGRRLGVSHAELRHREQPVCDWPARHDKVTMLLPLPASGDALWDAFKPKLRAQIRRPLKAGATVKHGGAELVDGFYHVFCRNMRDLGTPVYSKRFFAAILETFAAEAKIFLVEVGGEPAAAGLVLAHRDTLEIPWASSLRKHNPAGVNMLLYWSVLQYAADAGFRTFDFGRSSPDSGTFRFKAQWGAQPQALRWHYWQPAGGALPQISPSNPKYRAAIAAWKRLPLPVANILGPRLVKSLP